MAFRIYLQCDRQSIEIQDNDTRTKPYNNNDFTEKNIQKQNSNKTYNNSMLPNKDKKYMWLKANFQSVEFSKRTEF